MTKPLQYYLLGKSADLAFGELSAIYQQHNLLPPIRLTPFFASGSLDIDCQEIINISGGVVKVFYALDYLDSNLEETIAADLIESGNSHFAVSSLSRNEDLKNIAIEVKAKLNQSGIKPHFRLLADPYFSAGIVNKYTEYVLSAIPGIVLKTVAVQDLCRWTIKDYSRPAINPQSGMMPPKIARSLINLSLPKKPEPDILVYDPFCGSGTILNEALDLGCSVIGSDISDRAVTESVKNCEWFRNKFSPPGTYRVFKQDVAHLTQTELPNPVDCIVFEGYLGPPVIDVSKIKNILKGMEKLYKGAFKKLTPFLKSGGKIVAALPEYSVGKNSPNLDKLIDWTQTLGYTRVGYFTYGRPKAMVKRSIYVLQKSGQ